MLNRSSKVEHLLAFSLAATSFLWLGTNARAQSTPAQDNKIVQDNDRSRIELAQFHQFLDSHPEIAEQLRKDPSLADSEQFLKTHATLQTFLQQQPGIREELKENPNAFMREEDAFNRRDDGLDRDATVRRQLAEFNQFLDSHREIADQLRRDPSLADNEEFLKTHPELQTFLQQQPGIRDELKRDPNAFMRQEDAFDRRDDDLGRDAARRDLVEFNRFLDSHPEIAEQLRKDPSLADNQQFLKTHDALQAFLREQPSIREQLRENPNAFMRQEDAFDRDNRRDHDERMASFKGFLGGHANISEELSKDPTLIKNHEYVQNRPELEAYLNAHPDVREQLMNNPEDFVHGEQQYNIKDGGQSYGSWSGKTPATPTPTTTSPTTTPTTTPTPAPTHDSSSK
jgi:phage-related protein